MANQVEQALGQLQGFQTQNPAQLSGLRYQAAQIGKEEVGPSQLHQVFDSIINVAKPAVKEYDTYLQTDSQKRMAEADAEYQRTKNPQVYQDAIQAGTLFHHDNPYTKRMVYQSFGQQTQLEADSKTEEMVRSKTIPPSGPLYEQMKAKNREDAISTAKDRYQIDVNDRNFLQGFGDNINKSDAALNQMFEGYKSQTLHDQALLDGQRKLTSIFSDKKSTAEQRVRAAQGVIIQMHANNVLNDPAEYDKLVDFAHQQAYGADHVVGDAFSQAFIPVGYDDKGQPTYDNVGNIVGGNAVVTSRKLDAQKRDLSLNASFSADVANTLQSLDSEQDYSVALSKLEAQRREMKVKAGIDPNQVDQTIDPQFDAKRIELINKIDALNKKNAESLQKQQIVDEVTQDVYSQKVKAINNGETFDDQHITVANPNATDQQKKDANVEADKWLWKNWVNDPKITPNERSRRFNLYANSGAGSQYTVASWQVRNLNQQAALELHSGSSEHPHLDTLMQLHDADPTKTDQLLLNSDLYGNQGKEIYTYIQTIKAGGITTADYQAYQDFKQKNPDAAKQLKADSDKYILGDKQSNTKGALDRNDVPLAMQGPYQTMFENFYFKSNKNAELAEEKTNEWLRLNTVSIPHDGWFGVTVHNDVKFPVASIRVDGDPANDALAQKFIGDTLTKHNITNAHVQVMANGDINVVNLDTYDSLPITKKDIIVGVHGLQDQATKQTEAEKAKAQAKLESRGSENAPKSAIPTTY